MKKAAILLGLLLLTARAVFGDAPRVVQDPKTRVLYYLQSDLRHIAALDPDGNLLWCCEVVLPSAPARVRIVSFAIDPHDQKLLDVVTNRAAPVEGIIRTGSGDYYKRIGK